MLGGERGPLKPSSQSGRGCWEQAVLGNDLAGGLRDDGRGRARKREDRRGEGSLVKRGGKGRKRQKVLAVKIKRGFASGGGRDGRRL